MRARVLEYRRCLGPDGAALEGRVFGEEVVVVVIFHVSGAWIAGFAACGFGFLVTFGRTSGAEELASFGTLGAELPLPVEISKSLARFSTVSLSISALLDISWLADALS